MADKEYRDVDKHYKKSATKAKAVSTSSIPRAKYRWETAEELRKLEAEYFKSHGKKAPPGTFKKEEPKLSMKQKRKSFNQYFLEKHKQADLKKKIKKKKAEGAKVRAKKGS